MTGDRVKINVSGQIFEVSRNILDQYPDTMLASLVSERWANGSDDGEDTEVFVNGDGERFRYILDYLRTGRAILPLSVSKKALLADFEYFGFFQIDPEAIEHDDTAVIQHASQRHHKHQSDIEKLDEDVRKLKESFEDEIEKKNELIRDLEARLLEAKEEVRALGEQRDEQVQQVRKTKLYSILAHAVYLNVLSQGAIPREGIMCYLEGPQNSGIGEAYERCLEADSLTVSRQSHYLRRFHTLDWDKLDECMQKYGLKVECHRDRGGSCTIKYLPNESNSHKQGDCVSR